MKLKLLLLAIFFLCMGTETFAQVPVALLPDVRQQFLDVNAHPLAGGKVFFYVSGTTTPQATYVDVTGTIQNTNPLILDSGGYGVAYLTASSYRVCVQDAVGVQQWCQDGVNAFQIILGTNEIIFAGVTSFPAGQPGELIYRSDLGRFCFFNSTWDCIPGLDTIDTFENKTINVQDNVVDDNSNVPGTYLRNNGTQYVPSTIQASDLPVVNQTLLPFANNATPSVTNQLVKLAGSPASQVTNATTTDLTGTIGICVSGCGASGTAEVSVIGLTNCIFDGATTAGDYVEVSTSVAGNCHDGGLVEPDGFQINGRVLSTNGGGGTYQLLLFSPEIRTAVGAVVFSLINNVNSGPDSGSGPITTLSPSTFATTAGNLEVCIMQSIDAGSQTYAWADTAGNTWLPAASVNYAQGHSSQLEYSFLANSSASDTLTVTSGVNMTHASMICGQWGRSIGTWTFDANPMPNNNAGSFTLTSNTFSTIQKSEILIGAGISASGSTFTQGSFGANSATGSFVNGVNGTNSDSMMQFNFSSAIQSTIGATIAQASSNAWIMWAASFY